MNIGGGEAADQMVRMMLSGCEVAIRLTGSAAKNLLAMSLALARHHRKISGRMRMGKMLQQTRDLRVFPMTQAEYRAFRQRARGPKLLYAAIQEKNPPDGAQGMVDVIMPATEVERANLVFQRMMYQQPEPDQPVREKEQDAQKKDSRSGRGSRDTNINSPTRAGSGARTTGDERPSVEGRLQGYRARLEEQRRRAPARQKTKTRAKTR